MSYSTAHINLRETRGRASFYPCAAGCGNWAYDWAYDHDDPNEQVEVKGGWKSTYSSNPMHYIPLCRSCHQQLDRDHKLSPEKTKALVNYYRTLMTSDIWLEAFYENKGLAHVIDSTEVALIREEMKEWMREKALALPAAGESTGMVVPADTMEGR